MSLSECVSGCKQEDHERGGHEHFLQVTRNMYLTKEEQEMMLSGWERAWENRHQAVDNLLGAIQEAVDSLDASSNYGGEKGWQDNFLARHGLERKGRKVEIKED